MTGDLKLSGTPPGQGSSGRARTRDRIVPADLRAVSLSIVPPTPPYILGVAIVSPAYFKSWQHSGGTRFSSRLHTFSTGLSPQRHCGVSRPRLFWL
ncbi:hypothetical protein PoB_006905100 [Plakobranchus ocellatus]|uniref:Uncharacterized protein n=1 Tax=Plakobranchus ocellatus TaxID=259542 RepID=A0AAV4DEJ6_9GAST|nr:hypothetical protein PoB_006905100 [Plakobranchus ocellatus]